MIKFLKVDIIIWAMLLKLISKLDKIIFVNNKSELEQGYSLWKDSKKHSGLKVQRKCKHYSKDEVRKIILAIDDENKKLKDWYSSQRKGKAINKIF